ncbi:thiol:disulfide interchange protein DsbA/DsbL [Vibrio rumoiensis]|uniref:Thiol:disulfide interchange protein n=1 Tax=Vibrio rumoiensis 1S-45 TaxID=1188252 RepID=A0A1E5E303_9VIBR|nr:thiol:disulfide interchange protein DsbA/DsbL [Vibrio rumoiensis]OEF26053.1 thiol:disulfide interchange protein [Vibrio rumoiensis 1S-45]
MKKIFTLFAALLLSFAAQAERFPEGDYYKVVDLPHSSSPTVTEFFSFYCPHCNDFEPMIGALKKHLDGKADFEKVPVSFMGGNMGQPMSKAYATMVSLNVDDKLVPVLFNRIHAQRNPPKDEAELRQIFLDNGVSAADFDGTYNSFAVDSMVRRFDKSFKDSGLSGVPTVVVNNKYIVNSSKIKDLNEYFDLIDSLLKK